MNIIQKNYKITLFITIITLFLIGTYFKFDYLVQAVGLLISVFIFIYITRSALNNLSDCLYYLAFIAPIIGLALGYYANNSKYVPHFPFSDYVYYVILYFLIWLLIVIFGELKTVKLATFIIAQILTSLFLITSLALYLVPVQAVNDFVISYGVDIIELNRLFGYDSRKFIEVALQILLYPALLNSLLIYIIAELKQYREEKSMHGNYNNVV